MTFYTQPIEPRFWQNVRKIDGGGWEWTGHRDEKGYGRMSMNGRFCRVHRISLHLHSGFNIFDDLCVLHRCDNPWCVNPDHLFCGTNKDNSDDRDQKGRNVVMRGSSNGRAKIDEATALAIKRALATGTEQQKQIAKRFQTTEWIVRAIKKGICWGHVNG